MAPASPTAPTAEPPLPPALEGSRREFQSPAGRLSYYVDAPAEGRVGGPLLLVHSVNAAASAYEVKPLFDHYRQRRLVYAIELPGYGFSERSDRPYTLRLMTDAVLAMLEEIGHQEPGVPIDLLAVSLSCEFAARAASEQPGRVRTLALVSPTGLDRLNPLTGAPGASRGKALLLAAFGKAPWSPAFFRFLTRPGVIRFFLEKTWGGKRIDEGLLAYDVLTARQPGARYAPFYFVSGFLFSADATAVYERLTMPVWLIHGTIGDFVDYRYAKRLAERPNWHIETLPTGALPYFEVPARFIARYDAFLAADHDPVIGTTTPATAAATTTMR